VAKQYVTVFVEFDTAKSLDEIAAEEAAKKAAAEAAEEARRKAEEERKAAEEAAERAQQAAEEEARRKAEEEARKAAEAAAMAERNSLINYAKQFLGVTYGWGGESLTYGVDCSGFTMLVYGHYGYSLPHYSVYQANCGTRVGLDQIRPGDMLFYARNGVIYHVAIYIGNGQMIHAANESLGVTISSINYADIYCAVSIMP
ncbi:MAG: C40 family peptidase, partial [Lachnospiraceae bacterium]|nr:C40 family peptidase [Lachnospiraceae bacterium]